MWALQRSAMYRDMATIGVDVVSWSAEHSLEQSMGMLPERRHRVRGTAPGVAMTRALSTGIRPADGWRRPRRRIPGTGSAHGHIAVDCGGRRDCFSSGRNRRRIAVGGRDRAVQSVAGARRAVRTLRRRLPGVQARRRRTRRCRPGELADSRWLPQGLASSGWSRRRFPLQLPWLPLVAPLAVLAIYVLATRPFLG